MQGDQQKRTLLGTLVSHENEDNWWKTDLFERFTKKRLPKEVKVLQPPPAVYQNYNCYVHALGLQEDPSFLGEENFEFTCTLNQVFDESIADDALVQLDQPKEGCLIVYRAEKGDISHVGVMRNTDTVISKWSWGPVLQHAIFDVPDHYGDTVEYYTSGAEARNRALHARQMWQLYQ